MTDDELKAIYHVFAVRAKVDAVYTIRKRHCERVHREAISSYDEWRLLR